MKTNRHSIKFLHDAAKEKCLTKIKLYLDKGVDINATNIKGETIFHVAVQQNDIDTVRYLINRYLTVDTSNNENMQNSMLNVNAKNDLGETVLHLAVKHSDKDLIELLFQSNLAVDETDRLGSTALHYTVETQKTDRAIFIAELLLKFNANINTRDRNGESPLYLAVKLNKYALTKWFLSMGADPNNRRKFFSNKIPIFQAVKNGNMRIIRLLLQNGANINELNYLNDNPLLHAIQFLPEGKTLSDIAQSFIKAGIDVNHQNDERLSALTLAIQKESETLARLLISRGCTVNSQSAHCERCPLYLAVRHDMTGVVELLLQRGADPNVPISRGLLVVVSPLHCAVVRGNLEAAELLLRHGASPNRRLPGSRTPLNEAILLGLEKVAALLLRAGADVNLRDSFGSAPLHLLTENCELRANYEGLMQQLLCLGARVEQRSFGRGLTPLGLLEKPESQRTLRLGRILVRHMALRRYQNRMIGIKNVQLIAGSVTYAERFVQCINELMCMERTKIVGDVSFYDLLVERSHRLVQWVALEEVVRQIDEETFWRVRFRHYSDMVLVNYRSARKRLELLRRGSLALGRVAGVRLPPEVASIVCRMLGNEDLANLELARRRRGCAAAPPRFAMSLRKRRKV